MLGNDGDKEKTVDGPKATENSIIANIIFLQRNWSTCSDKYGILSVVNFAFYLSKALRIYAKPEINTLSVSFLRTPLFGRISLYHAKTSILNNFWLHKKVIYVLVLKKKYLARYKAFFGISWGSQFYRALQSFNLAMACYTYKINVTFSWDFGWHIRSSLLTIVCWSRAMHEPDPRKVTANPSCLVNPQVKAREAKKRYPHENGYFKVVNNEPCRKTPNRGF